MNTSKTNPPWHGTVICPSAVLEVLNPAPSKVESSFPHSSCSHRHVCAEDHTVKGVDNKCEELN